MFGRITALTCCGYLLVVVAVAPSARAATSHAAASGGSGRLTTGGRIGPLRLDRSRRSGVVRFAGRPQAEKVTGRGADRRYDALGYSCSKRSTFKPFRFTVGRRHCRTVVFINRRTRRLATFVTSTRRYSVRGVRVGATTKRAERRLHRRAVWGCSAAFCLNSKRARLTIALIGGRTAAGGHVAGGHVYALALRSATHDVGAFDCL